MNTCLQQNDDTSKTLPCDGCDALFARKHDLDSKFSPTENHTNNGYRRTSPNSYSGSTVPLPRLYAELQKIGRSQAALGPRARVLSSSHTQNVGKAVPRLTQTKSRTELEIELLYLSERGYFCLWWAQLDFRSQYQTYIIYSICLDCICRKS